MRAVRTSNEMDRKFTIIILLSIFIQILPNISIIKPIDAKILLVVQFFLFSLFLLIQGKENIKGVLRHYIDNRNSILLAFIIFFLVSLISAVFSDFSIQSAYRLVTVYFNIITIFYMVISVGDVDKMIYQFFKVIFYVGAISAVYSFILDYFSNEIDIGFLHLTQNIVGRRPSSFLGNPNFFAIILFLGICSYFLMIANKKNIILFPLLLVQAYALLETKSRAAIISLFIVVVLIVIYKLRYKKLALTILLSILGIVSVLIFIVVVNSRGSQTNGRTEIWLKALEVFWKKPIFGHGFGMSIETIGITGGLSTHNVYIKILVETGIIGLISFLNIFFQSGLKLLKKLNHLDNDSMLLSIGIVSALMFHQFFESNLFVYNIIMSFWLLIMAYICVNLERKEIYE